MYLLGDCFGEMTWMKKLFGYQNGARAVQISTAKVKTRKKIRSAWTISARAACARCSLHYVCQNKTRRWHTLCTMLRVSHVDEVLYNEALFEWPCKEKHSLSLSLSLYIYIYEYIYIYIYIISPLVFFSSLLTSSMRNAAATSHRQHARCTQRVQKQAWPHHPCGDLTPGKR